MDSPHPVQPLRGAEPDLGRRLSELEAIYASAPVGLCALDRELRFVSVNQRMAEFNGLTIEEHLGRTVREVVPHIADVAEEALTEVLRTGEPLLDAEIVGETPGRPGVLRTWIESWLPLRDEEGGVIGINIVAQELTEQRQAQRRLLDTEARLRSALDAADVGTWRVDLESGLETRGAAANRILGLAHEESTQPVEDYFARLHPEDRPGVRRAWDDAVAAGGVFDVEARVVRPDGAVRWLRDRGRVVRGPDGAPEHATGAIVDVTDRRAAEETLRESERRFRNMADHSPAMIWVTEASGCCVFLSRAWFDFTGQTEEEALGFGWLEAVHPDDRPRSRETLYRALEQRGGFRLEYRLRSHDGAWHWAIDSAAPRFDERGEFLGHVGSVIDVTDLKRAEQALLEVDRRKDEFLAILGHELRNPLNALANGIRMLRDEVGSEEEQRWAREMMGGHVDQLRSIIDDLLDITRISRGMIEIRPRTVGLLELVERAVDSVGDELEARHHELVVLVEPPELLVHADPTRLEQVLSNLLSNAARYTDPGGRVEVRARPSGAREVEIAVIDNGRGLDEEALAQAFLPFTQGERGLGGLGIGLPLTRQLIELHGGRVAAESAGPGRGSTFTLWLRRGRAQPGPGEPASPAKQVAGREGALRVLVVDDNVDAARALSLLLRAQGHRVDMATTGGEALERARASLPEVVLLDLALPDVSGYEVAETLRAEAATSDALLIAVTGFGDEAARRRVRESGFDAHVLKPIDVSKLRETLRARAGRRRR